MSVVTDSAWKQRANCRGATSEMFPSSAFGVIEALRRCAECPVRRECLEFSILMDEGFGIWGGKSERERRRLRRRFHAGVPLNEVLDDAAKSTRRCSCGRARVAEEVFCPSCTALLSLSTTAEVAR